MAAKKNEQHPLRIEGYGSAGEGVARLEGQAVFVKGALAGEICQVQLLKVGKSAAWGRAARRVVRTSSSTVRVRNWKRGF